jgi:hypothetical protein
MKFKKNLAIWYCTLEWYSYDRSGAYLLWITFLFILQDSLERERKYACEGASMHRLWTMKTTECSTDLTTVGGDPQSQCSCSISILGVWQKLQSTTTAAGDDSWFVLASARHMAGSTSNRPKQNAFLSRLLLCPSASPPALWACCTAASAPPPAPAGL